MRSAVFVAILVSASALLAGCSDKKDGEEHTYTCPDGSVLDLEQFPDHDNATFNPLSKCAKGSSTNSTSLAPNVLPTLVLTVTDDGGNATPITLLDGNLTFSAEGSTDSDGQITGIAVSVTDSNTTRTATLYDAAAKTFKSATFKFDRPGIVNVTVAMVDDRAGFTVNQTKVYVNHPQQLAPQTIQLPDSPGLAEQCSNTLSPLVDANYWKPFSFALGPNATYVEAMVTGGDATIGICTPDEDLAAEGHQGTLLSNTGSSVITNPGVVLTAPTGIQSYIVGAKGNAPSTQVAIFVLVHYEPQVAAPAA